MQRVLMCRPTHFRVDYVINPWMQVGSVDRNLAQQQWQQLVANYQQLGLQVSILEQDESLPDMVFAADQGVMIDNGSILLSRFTYPERAGESALYQAWYEAHGITVRHLPEGMNFEGGGELQRWRDMLFIGTGFRTDLLGAQTVGKICKKEVLPIELVDSSFYHLDTCLFVLDDSTVFYYPPAFSNHTLAQLQSLVPNLIQIDDHDTQQFAANSVVVRKTVLMQPGSVQMPQQLQAMGYTVLDVDVSEFIKAGGGAHCLTGDLGN